MSKRQKRINPKDILSNLNEYKERHLTFVLNDGRSILGKIEKTNKAEFYLRNTFGHKIIITLPEISEIWMEEKVVE